MTSKVEEVIAARQGVYLRKDIHGNQAEVWAIPYERAKRIVTELEAALAECEQEGADLERKLAAARKATASLVNYIPQLLRDYKPGDVPGIWLPYETWQAILAALTEASERPEEEKNDAV